MLHMLTRWVWEKRRNTAGPEWEECKFKQPHPFPNVFLAALCDSLDIFSSRFPLQKLIIPNLIFIIKKWTENCCQPPLLLLKVHWYSRLKRRERKGLYEALRRKHYPLYLNLKMLKVAKRRHSPLSPVLIVPFDPFSCSYLFEDKCFIT